MSVERVRGIKACKQEKKIHKNEIYIPYDQTENKKKDVHW